ncbi:MAG: 4-(cytidine 5'-diphospho)-2-C-methyl-D-erythritol kinase [Planctomycetota bacterium]
MTPTVLNARAYAKINWDLRILGKRPDNFHELDSIFVTIGLSDSMRFELADDVTMTCSDPTLPVDASNLVMKAAMLLKQSANCSLGARIHLEKSIPMGGGLGGGSSDAACALDTLNRLWNLNWSIDQLADIAAQIGSDVAYFLYGGWCLCRGRGEIVHRLAGTKNAPPVDLFLILPPLHVATPAVYKAMRYPQWEGLGGREAEQVGTSLGSALASLNQGAALELRNDLMPPALSVEPKLAAIQSVLQRELPGRWLMSGSGASHFAIPNMNQRGSVNELAEHLNSVVPGTRVIATETRA